MEGHIGQTVHPSLHPGIRLRDAQVVFPEEFGVRQTCGQHFFVPRQNGRAIIGGGAIGDGDKAFDAARLGVAHGKELLVLFHGGLQHLRWQTKEIFANLPHQHDRIFHQPCDLGQKPRILDDLKPVGKSHIGRVVPDRIAPLCGVQHDKGAFQLGAIVLKAADRDRIRCHKAVPARGVASGDPIDGQGHNLRAVFGRKDAQDRMQRTHPPQRAGAPPHGFGPWEGANGGFQHLCHDLGCGAARLVDHGEQDLALGGVALFQLVTGQARAAQEPFDGFFGRVGLGAFALFGQGRAGVQHSLDREGQAARCRKGRGRGIGQTRIHQSVRHQFLKIIRRARLHTGGNFFREKLNQEVGHGFVPFGAACRSVRLNMCRANSAKFKGPVIRVGVNRQGVPGRLRPPRCRHRICRHSRSARARHSRARPR